MDRIGPNWTRIVDAITPRRENRTRSIKRHTWPKMPRIDLRRMRVSTPKAPKLPTLDDRMERFLVKLSEEIAEEATKALNELAMMVTAEAIERGVPAAEILTPVAARIVGRCPIDQINPKRLKQLAHGGGKTREGIINMVLGLFEEALLLDKELEPQFEILKMHLNNEDVDLESIQGWIYGQSATFANALERYGEDRIAPAMARCFKRILPELDMRIAGAILSRVGAAGKSIARELPKFSKFDGTDWVEKRARIMVMFHDAFYQAGGREPPTLEATQGYGALCFEFLEEYPKRSAIRDPDRVEGKGKERGE